MILRLTIVLLCMSIVPGFSQNSKSILAEANSIDALIEFSKSHSGYGIPQWASFSHGDLPIFVIWNDPFSGRSAVFVRAYFKQDDKWKLFLDTLIESTSWVSPRLSGEADTLVFYAAKDKEALQVSLKNLKPLK